ncbi:hypothetical protein C2G38_2198383 [Gigaspora rosea]|uniref:Restriction endonuclease type IV Mrr domain-containing protein n=1 Tax=Gigaspora rosea TaxID=44941 RepID=A0A397UUE1_9GLOM|nr:hypothetical protein C2G38_2198383 [Gigaspora rosea]
MIKVNGPSYKKFNFQKAYDFWATNEIKVTQGDDGIDIIATYQNNIALIQCKNIESAISNKRNKLTPKAKIWVSTSKENIKVCNEKEIVEVIKEFFTNEFNLEEFGITSKNVSIEQMVIKKNSNHHKPY